MASRRSVYSPVLTLVALSLLLGDASHGASGREGAEAAASPGASLASDPAPAALSDGGLAALQRHIERREYRASVNRDGLQAPNREHNLRTYFGPTGIRVHDRTRSDAPELLELNLVGVGRGETPARIGPGEVTSEGGRVEIVRPGLIEWYENSPAGLEQGVTLMEQPAGEGPLVVELLVRGARASLGDAQVTFATPTGRKLNYAKLVVLDARGRTLDSHFEVPEHSRLRLVVDDDGAAYPVVIDPLLTASADSQIESDQLYSNLGVSVAAAGDVNGDGYADVIVGAHLYDAGEVDEGAAFVFLGSADGIVANGNPANADSQLESNKPEAQMGWSVAGAGDVNGDGYADVIVGAYTYTRLFFPDPIQTEAGAAFIFLGSASGIVANGTPQNADTQIISDRADSWLGYAVAGAGDIDDDGYADVIVGAPSYNVGPGSDPQQVKKSGAVFIYHGSASGVSGGGPASADTQLKARDDQLGSFFGRSVAGAGDVNDDGYADVIVGAVQYEAGEIEEGAAFVFHGSAGGIANGDLTTAAAQLESDQEYAKLGQSVAGAGDINGDGYADVIVGAYRYDAGENEEGAAFIFFGGASGIVANGNPANADVQLESNLEWAWLGWSVAGAGDVNDDGAPDVIVGAPVFDEGQLKEGAAFVFLSDPTLVVVPEPTSIVGLAAGFACLATFAGLRRRRTRAL
ncbi:MAG: FG-GAP repeat protein [Deltaproteobacteria bacterium]|jgi:hypothetical protein|nr:FG-GAP repeat protein [Deltaproteobacteria bacterium]